MPIFNLSTMNRLILIILISFSTSQLLLAQTYLNPDSSLDVRVKDLISRLTLEEKTSLMIMHAEGIPRLNIPPYDYWSEALHGQARSGKATVFPQAIGMAATFDTDLIFRIATAISDEARAKFNATSAAGNYNRYAGLTFWTPNVNIFRDPRWGRGQETYGEDPWLTGTLGAAFVKGMQGDNPKYLKTGACAKHFAVHSGPEKLRHQFNAVVSPKDLNETYLPAFKSLVDAGVEAVMCAYNSTNGEPCCANNYLLSEVLLKKWGFKGHILSDCWALSDFFRENGHHIVENMTEAAALAVKSGVDLNCGVTYNELANAVKQGLVSESTVDSALAKVLTTRFKLGLFDPADANPYSKITMEVVDSKEHRQLAYEAAAKSVVLLKNNGVLPLKDNLKRYLVVGPNASSIDALIGNYYGMNPNMVTVVEGITSRASAASQVRYQLGTELDHPNTTSLEGISGDAEDADATIVVLGLTRNLEGEEGESISSPFAGDRLDYNLPDNQIQYLKAIRGNHKKPIIAVVTGGCPMNLQEVQEIADAVLFAWYPGEEGGNAIADMIFGKVNPSGRLPITFPKSLDQLPPYEDYSMAGRTYRYMTATPMYPFGFGLSYTRFTYTDPKSSSYKIKEGETAVVSCKVANTGNLSGQEVVQLYVTAGSDKPAPLYSLKGVQRVELKPGESKEVKFTITPEMLQIVNATGESYEQKGNYLIYLSGSLPSERSMELGSSKPAEIVLKLN